jgi:hypothetical protein
MHLENKTNDAHICLLDDNIKLHKVLQGPMEVHSSILLCVLSIVCGIR